MPDVEISLSVVITIIVSIFSAGITYGVMAWKQKHQTTQIEEIVDALKDVVTELRMLTTELQVMKASGTRAEKDIEDHEKRIAALELQFAKLQAQLQ